MNLRTKLLMSVSATALTVCISSPTISQTYYSFGNSTYGSDGTTCITIGNTSFCN